MAAVLARCARPGRGAVGVALAGLLAALLAATGHHAQAFTSGLRAAPRGRRSSRVQLQGERKQSSDNFIDKAFTQMADVLVTAMPLAQQEKDAYQFYRDGMAAQTSGDYSTALRAYAEALKLEEDPIDRSFIFYNLGIIFASNGEYVKSVKYYHLALDQNKEMCQTYNNIAVIYHNQGERAERKGNIEKARVLYDKAGEYWNQAIRIAPTNYMEAQRWLKETNRMWRSSDEKIGGIF